MTAPFDEGVAAALAAHDALIARRRVDVWVGGEPTFTRPDSLAAAWTTAAEGDDKLERAHAVAAALADRLPGAAVARVVGRQYPGEPHARFAFGVRWAADADPDEADDDAGEHGGAANGGTANAGTANGGSANGGSANAGSANGGSANGGGGNGRNGSGEHATGAVRGTSRDEPAPPPTDLAGDRWLTVTPDPGVVEVNMAPCSSSAAFAAHAADVWAAARAAGLSPTRHRFNGDVADSGGGGQLTLGGAAPSASPFARYPHVLPALIRYVNNHPSLSYWFASECVGAASQGPRPDEGTRERYDELAIALAWLETLADRGELSPEQLWRALGPLLVDAGGNSHRAELNVEKLWNPHLGAHGPRHGCMGLVEWRAVRMPERPEMLASLAALVRGIVARLVVADYREPLIDWHDELHDRFALPAALSRDLRLVFGDLDEHGLGLPAQLRRQLDAWRPPGIACRLGDATLELRPALEFWPLVGDVASQEREAARWVDASTQRWELAITGPGPDRVVVAGKWAQLRALGDGTRAIGVRRRIYQPAPGFHPGLPALDPLVVEWSWQDRTQRIELWSWRRTGGPYEGLPADDTAALARRTERVSITQPDRALSAAGYWPEQRPFTIDLRHTMRAAPRT